MFLEFGPAGSSQRQGAGDHVQASSIGKLLEMQRKRCATLSQVARRYSNQLWKIQTGRTHRISSTETSMRSALSASVGQNSRQVLLEHHEEIIGNRTRAERNVQWMVSISPRRCQVHGGQLQLHRNEGHLQSIELYCASRP